MAKIGSAEYYEYLARIGIQPKNTNSADNTGSSGSSGSTGSTQKGSATGSFGSTNSTGSTGSAGSAGSTGSAAGIISGTNYNTPADARAAFNAAKAAYEAIKNGTGDQQMSAMKVVNDVLQKCMKDYYKYNSAYSSAQFGLKDQEFKLRMASMTLNNSNAKEVEAMLAKYEQSQAEIANLKTVVAEMQKVLKEVESYANSINATIIH